MNKKTTLKNASDNKKTIELIKSLGGAKSIHNYLPIIGDHETLTFPDLVKKNKISGYVSKSFWTSIESHKELDEVEKKLQSGKITF